VELRVFAPHPVERLAREQEALELAVRAYVGRALAAREHACLAERHSRRNRREALLLPARKVERRAALAGNDEVKPVRLVALANDGRAARVRDALAVGAELFDLRRRHAAAELLVGKLTGFAGAEPRRDLLDQGVLAPFDAALELAERADAGGVPGAELLFGETDERGHARRAGQDRARAGVPDGANQVDEKMHRRNVDARHAAKVEDHEL